MIPERWKYISVFKGIKFPTENSDTAEFVFSTEEHAEPNWCFSKEKSQAYHASYAVRESTKHICSFVKALDYCSFNLSNI